MASRSVILSDDITANAAFANIMSGIGATFLAHTENLNCGGAALF
jgi:hypothetical protein